MILTSLAFAAALLAQATSAAATEPAAEPTASQAPAEPASAKRAEAKKVCVTEAQMGSHFKKRICATPEEWAARRRRDAEVWARSQGGAQCRGEGC